MTGSGGVIARGKSLLADTGARFECQNTTGNRKTDTEIDVAPAGLARLFVIILNGYASAQRMNS